MTTLKLKFMPYAQAHVTADNCGNLILTSYATDVARLSNDGWLEIYGLYSMTTRRHIMAFCKEYAAAAISGFDTVKWLVRHDHKINIHTGEVVECGA